MEIATLALRDQVPFLYLPQNVTKTCQIAAQRSGKLQRRTQPSPGSVHGRVPIGCFGVEKYSYFLLPPAKESANRWRMGMGGWVSAFLHSSFGRLFPFGGTWGGLSEPPPFWSGDSLGGLTPPSCNPTLFSSIPSLLPSLSLLTSSPFVQRFFRQTSNRLSLRSLFLSCSLVHKKE